MFGETVGNLWLPESTGIPKGQFRVEWSGAHENFSVWNGPKLRRCQWLEMKKKHIVTSGWQNVTEFPTSLVLMVDSNRTIKRSLPWAYKLNNL